MQDIGLSIAGHDIICAETPSGPCGIVVFGASGDLVRRKLLVSLFRLFQQELISEHFFVLGAGRKELSDEDFRKDTEQVIREKTKETSPPGLDKFLNLLYYIAGDYNERSFYDSIKSKSQELCAKHHVGENIIFYLSVPPFLYPIIIEHLGSANLSCRPQTKIVIEKPFGRDLQSASELNQSILKCFTESQVYRIDHYLGKETVQNILMFRFANSIFEPIWNRNYIDHIQITIAESVGIEHRAAYYEHSGALRDMFQNHMLQMLTLAAMEPPISFEADSIRDEKSKLLKSIRPFKLDDIDKYFIRGQYREGIVNGKNVAGYKSEHSVATDSKTETYVAAKMFIDNLRWKDVPFYMRTGKRLSAKYTEIAVTFKKVPHSMFASFGMDDMPANVLVFQIQPREGIILNFQAKRPGAKTCISTLSMNFKYSEIFSTEMPESYQRLLLDCMLGDQTLYTRQDTIETSWKILTPVLEAWQNSDTPPFEYPSGAESFPAANNLIESDNRNWRKISE